MHSSRAEELFRRGTEETLARCPNLAEAVREAAPRLLSTWIALDPQGTPELSSERSYTQFLHASLRGTRHEARTASLALLRSICSLTARSDLRVAHMQITPLYATV